jgi:hypothetical protein
MPEEMQEALQKVFEGATDEQKAAFNRMCSGTPDELDEKDLELAAPLLERAKAAVLEHGEPPVRTEKPAELVDLTGHFFPHNGSVGDAVLPCFVQASGSTALYLPCFSTPEKLQAMMATFGVSYAGIKKIDDGMEFVRSLPMTMGDRDIKVILDPYVVPERGSVRWVEIFRS